MMMMKHKTICCRTTLLLAFLVASLRNDAVSGFSVKMESSSLLPINKNWNRRQLIQSTVSASAFLLGSSGYPSRSLAAYIDPNRDMPAITKRVYLDVQIGNDDDGNGGLVHPKGRIVIGLFGDLLPRTVGNFVSLCEQNAYAGTNFYRVLSDYCVQGGAIGDASGKTGRSSFTDGKPFEPDNYDIRHTKSGIVSMVRGLDGSVDSRFFIQGSGSGDSGGVFDDRYAAFGIVLQDNGDGGGDGMDFVRRIEKVDVQPPKNIPKVDVKIIASGVLPS
jgi:peptidyl-prolyl cis-trans isomerase B (cyclophilin B)